MKPAIVYPGKCCFEMMTENQKKFVRAAKRQKLTLKPYSGKFMYGMECPSVVVSPFADVKFNCETNRDHMGLDIVIYAPH